MSLSPTISNVLKCLHLDVLWYSPFPPRPPPLGYTSYKRDIQITQDLTVAILVVILRKEVLTRIYIQTITVIFTYKQYLQEARPDTRP